MASDFEARVQALDVDSRSRDSIGHRHREQIDGILVNDDWGTQETLMIRPEYWRKVYKPAYAKIVAAIKAGAFDGLAP